MSTLESIKAAMAATNALFGAEVIAKRDYDAFDQIYTSNARILPPGAPMVTGRDEIKKFWKGFIESANVVAGSLESVDVMQAGNDIVEIGNTVIQVRPDQGGDGIDGNQVCCVLARRRWPLEVARGHLECERLRDWVHFQAFRCF